MAFIADGLRMSLASSSPENSGAAMGIIGAAVISNRAFGLMRAAGAVLLDIRPNAELVRSVRECLERGSDRVADLHLWRVGPGHNTVIATIVSHEPQTPSFYKGRLAQVAGLNHVTIEVERCAQRQIQGGSSPVIDIAIESSYLAGYLWASPKTFGNSNRTMEPRSSNTAAKPPSRFDWLFAPPAPGDVTGSLDRAAVAIAIEVRR